MRAQEKGNIALCNSRDVAADSVVAGAPEYPLDKLAFVLFAEMEHMDPTEDFDWDVSPEVNWLRLDDCRKTFYRTCVCRLGLETELWEAVFKLQEIRRLQSCK